ncbi:MAG: NAD(P)-dependent oxidoreductase [Myxococcales bacterium]|nr:NAD(P)-dependent oxidoreductase [Myxococcales bacterium]
MKAVLVTGAQGFVGSRLLPAVGAAPFEGDLLDFAALEKALGARPWTAVVHLAAISHVPTCERDPSQAFRVNLAGTALVLEAMRRHAPDARLIFPSSAQVYATADGVLDEESPVEPQNVYARTKWQAELLIRDSGLRATVLRLFNHTHKSQSPDFFVPHLYTTLRQGTREVPVGNLEISRDIGVVQDLVAAFVAALSRGPDGVFNVCSGAPKRLSRVAIELARRLGVDARFVVEPSRVRAGEPAMIAGSHRRLTEATGWRPDCPDEARLVERFLAD